MSLRVMHILRAPLGGAFRHVYDLARGQSERGVDVCLVCDDSFDAPATREKLGELGRCCSLGVHTMPIGRAPGPSDVRAIRRIKSLARELGVQILHGHGAKGAAYARIVAPGTGARSVCTPHGGSLHFSAGSLSGMFYLTLEKALKRRTDGALFESAYAERMYEAKIGAMPFPHRVVPNGVYDTEFEPIDSSGARYDFVFIGEYRKLKGIFVLLSAMKMLSSQRSSSLLMVGSGPEESVLKAEAADFGPEARVSVSAPIHPARKAFAEARIVVAPSISESMPYLVLEAIAAGMPLITTRAGGIPEIYGPFAEDLIEPGDPDALAAKMRDKLDEPAQARATAEALRTRALSHLSVTQMERRIFEFYCELLGRAPF